MPQHSHVQESRALQLLRRAFTVCALAIVILGGCVRDEIRPGLPTAKGGGAAANQESAKGDTTSHAAHGDAAAAAEPDVSDETSGENNATSAVGNETLNGDGSNVKFTPLTSKVKFKTDGGATIWSFKAAGDGAKLLDGDETEFARFNVREARVKVKKHDDSETGNIRISKGRLKVDNPEGEKLFELQRQDDGDWKLDDADEKLIYKIKRRDYGYEIEDASEASLFKIKFKGDKLSIRDADDKTIMATKDKFPPLAAATMMLEAIEEPTLRFGLAAAIALQVDDITP